MATDTTTAPARGTARTRILEAALHVIRERGLHATTVDDLCAVAGVTKGAFFHHFKSKDDLAVSAAEYWHSMTGEMFADADYHRLPTPWQRLMGYLDLRAGWIEGATAEYTCLVGTMVQEAYVTHPQVRDACRVSMLGHAATLEAEFALLLEAAPEVSGVTPTSLAEHTQTVLQGAFVLAKATGDPEAVLTAIEHLRRYFELLFPAHVKENA